MDHSSALAVFASLVKSFYQELRARSKEKLRPNYVAGKKRGDDSQTNYFDVSGSRIFNVHPGKGGKEVEGFCSFSSIQISRSIFGECVTETRHETVVIAGRIPGSPQCFSETLRDLKLS